MQFQNSYFFFAFLVIPMIILVYFLMLRWRKKARARFGDTEVISKLYPEASETKRTWKFILFTIAFALLILGLINPMIGTKLENVKRNGADLMICLDVSNSMKAEDLSPNRLERAKLAIDRLLQKLDGDRVGIIVFAGEAYVQLPITSDYSAAKLFLESINTNLVPTQGTNIGEAIRLSIKSFGKDEGKNKAIIIITDGEDNEAAGVQAAELAAEKGISIHTIGMGSVQGAPIPEYRNGQQEGYKKDKSGNTVVTKLNEQILQEIAATGSGVYVHATNSDAGLNSVLDAIDKLEKKQFESKMYSDYEDRFQWAIAPALLLLLIETFISERRSRIYSRLKIFEDDKK